MNKQNDFIFFSKLMNAADMGWWKADLTTLNYECSEYISELLGLDDSGIISFEDFNKRILKEEQRPTTVHSFSEQQMSEVVYLLVIRPCSTANASCIIFISTCRAVSNYTMRMGY